MMPEERTFPLRNPNPPTIPQPPADPMVDYVVVVRSPRKGDRFFDGPTIKMADRDLTYLKYPVIISES
jgi:hypothetical protein